MTGHISLPVQEYKILEREYRNGRVQQTNNFRAMSNIFTLSHPWYLVFCDLVFCHLLNFYVTFCLEVALNHKMALSYKML